MRVASETFPDSETVSYSYNEAGWLSSVPGYINSITYNARGQKTQLQYANGVTTNWTFNAQNFRVTNRSTSGASGSFQNLSYTYDNVGNITSITDPIYTSDRTTFTYDPLNRLTSASGTFGTNQGQTSCNYSFNAIGNITDKCGISYSYADAAHPSAVTSTSDGKSYTYDANGNMLAAGSRTQAWDYDNRLSSVTASGSTTSMVYDYTGMRTEKSGPLGTTIFPFSGYEIGPGGISVKYVRIGIENVASKKSTGEKFFYHNDHLGGVNVITNTSGVLAQLIEYDPWGKVSRSEGGGDSLRRFTGKILDPESGLYYYGGRYYDPELGRFISPDPFVPQFDDPQSHNRYSYVVNNPVNNIDPDGYSHEKKKKKKKRGFFGKLFGAFKIIFGVFQLLTGNPSGLLNIASGASSFSSSKGAQIFSHITGFVGAFSSLPGGEGPPGGGGGSPFGSSLFNLSPALHGGDDGVGGGGLGGFGVFASLGGEVFSLVNTLRSQRPGDDFPETTPSPLVLASHAGIPFGCMNPVARCEPLPPSRSESEPPKGQASGALTTNKDPSRSTRPGPDSALERATRRQICEAAIFGLCEAGTGFQFELAPLCLATAFGACNIIAPETMPIPPKR